MKFSLFLWLCLVYSSMSSSLSLADTHSTLDEPGYALPKDIDQGELSAEFGFDVRPPSTEQIASCEKEQCLVGLFLTKYRFLDEKNFSLLFNDAWVDAIKQLASSANTSLREIIDGCDFFPKRKCFSEVLFLRQRIYKSDSLKSTVGCFVMGGNDNKGFFVSYGLSFAWDGTKWRGLNARKHISAEMKTSYSSLSKNPCFDIDEVEGKNK
jgi:hypothetical protein